MRVSRSQVQRLEKAGRLSLVKTEKPKADPHAAMIQAMAEAVVAKMDKARATPAKFKFEHQRDGDGKLMSVTALPIEGTKVAYKFKIERNDKGLTGISAETIEASDA